MLDLLNNEIFRELSLYPSKLEGRLTNKTNIVVIDEIQRMPELLNEVHRLIENKNVKFLLTGSSARKLRRRGVNLLGGRASFITFHPFVSCELKDKLILDKALSTGLLPPVYLSSSPIDELKDYVEVYLREEIAAETAIRNLPAYSRFLEVAALCNSQIINYTKIANDAQLPPTTVREYFTVLEDTLIAKRLPAFPETKKRKAASTAKFYFFDIGVARYLQGRKHPVVEDTAEFGESLETFIFQELSAGVDYGFIEGIKFWKSYGGYEVDFLIGDHTALEVKAARRISKRHKKGLLALKEEKVFKRYIIVSLDSNERTEDGIEIMHINTFLNKLWNKVYTE